MTDKPTPKEIDDLVYELRQAGKDDTYSLASAVLEKWGTPSPVGAEPVALLVRKNSWREGQWEAAPPNSPSYGLAWANQRMYVYTTPQPTQPQAGAVPLDEARHLFDAGWKAAALFCDREDVVADGIIGFGACPQFEAAFSAANGIKGGQHGTE